MSTTNTSDVAERLYWLLPTAYRIRDAENGLVLRDLVEVVAEQVEILAEEIDQLYDDQFVETAAEWVAPYLGDLIGYRVLHGQVPRLAAPRAEVANTIGYRRRKGTAAVLEQLARDVTQWPARAVEYFERLTTTQYMNHPRLHSLATVDLRDHTALGWVGPMAGAFDDVSRTVDVRAIDARRPATPGRHNIPHVGILLWRTEAWPRVRVPLVEAGEARRFRFDPLGADTPLYATGRTETEITHLAEPFDVPLPLGRRWLADHLGAYYGPTGSLLVEEQDGSDEPVAVAAPRIRICDLSDTATGWAHEPDGDTVAVDPVLGRVYLGTALGAGQRLLGTWHQGLAVPVGAGTRLTEPGPRPEPVVQVGGGTNIQGALDSVAGGGTVEIADSERYGQAFTVRTDPAPAGEPDPAVHVTAATGTRPHWAAASPVRLDLAPRSTVVLDGLLVSRGPLVLDEVGDGQARRIVLRHCTFVPGQRRTETGEPVTPERASLIVLDPFAEVVLEHCVTGPVVAVTGSRVVVRDSVVDAGDPGAVAIAGRATGGELRTVETVADQVVGDGTEPAGGVDLHESTVIGGITCIQLDASNSLLVARLPEGDPRRAAVYARRRQVGCIRFSYLPEGSRTGKRYRTQPDPAAPPAVRHGARPRFPSLRFGDPGYAQLAAHTPDSIRRGADDESEMGVTRSLYAPQREANLALRLDEYLRFGLVAGFGYAT